MQLYTTDTNAKMQLFITKSCCTLMKVYYTISIAYDTTVCSCTQLNVNYWIQLHTTKCKLINVCCMLCHITECSFTLQNAAVHFWMCMKTTEGRYSSEAVYQLSPKHGFLHYVHIAFSKMAEWAEVVFWLEQQPLSTYPYFLRWAYCTVRQYFLCICLCRLTRDADYLCSYAHINISYA